MSLLAWCIIAHLVGDFLVQTEYEAMNKAKGEFFNTALFNHCLKYTACFFPLCCAYQMPLFWLWVICSTHLVFDRRWPIIAWRRYVTRCSEESIACTFWLTVVIDQIFHLLVIVAVVSFTA